MKWLPVLCGSVVALVPVSAQSSGNSRGDNPVAGSLPLKNTMNAGGSNGVDGVIMVDPNDKTGEVGGEADIYTDGPVVRKLGTIKFRAYIGTVGDANAKAEKIAEAINSERGTSLKELVHASSSGGVVTLSGGADTNVGAIAWTKGDDTTCEKTRWVDDRASDSSGPPATAKGVTFWISGPFSGVRTNGKPARLRIGTDEDEGESVVILSGDTVNTVLRRLHGALADVGQRSTLTIQGGFAVAITLPDTGEVTAGLWDSTGYCLEWSR